MFIKKNQIIIFILALLLITVGYLEIGKEFKDETIEIATDNVLQEDENENLGDATLVNSAALVPNDEIEKNTTETTPTSSKVDDDYFANLKLQRETMYSQTLESYQKIIDSSEISSEQKSIAQNEIIKINNEKNSILITENLILTKGFSNVVIFVNNENVSVIVKTEKLNTEDVAKIQNIVSRELNTQISNIHISNK
ncbi:MAG: SpoIIIAH-like family protein [Clostridia bacterium]|nr:SpoIIIAH-like family protein [Clostridia bacterium]